MESKRGPGRPRRYPSVAEEGPSDGSQPMEVNILSIQPEQSEKRDTGKKVKLGEVLEIAVQSLSVTMAEEEVDDKEGSTSDSGKHKVESIVADDSKVTQPLTSRRQSAAAEEHDSDFEWKLDNEEETVAHSPPVKRKKVSSTSVIPTVSCYVFSRDLT